MGTRYAYDFVQVDWNRTGTPAYRVGVVQYLFAGVKLRDYYCYGREAYSPCDGVVVSAEDGYAEPAKTNLLRDMSAARGNARYFDPRSGDIRTVAGNYVILQHSENVYAALCHLRPGSLRVAAGERIAKGALLGNIGNSGNSFAPHLHFQLMDSCDMARANGIPCAFREYEILQNGQWKQVAEGIPTNKDRIRYQGS